MKVSAMTVRRGLYGMFAGALLGGMATATILMPSANAAPDDPCSVGGMNSTQSSVSASMSTYLQAHPDTNQALTDIAKQTPAQASASYRTYFANNPQVTKDLKAIQQPVTDLATQCNTQVTPSLVVDALQAT